MSDKIKTIDPFNSDSIDKPEADTRSIGLCVPTPLSSADLEAKYGAMRHDGIELLYPTQFEDADGHLDKLTAHDKAALKHLGITEEEYYILELERTP